MISLELAKELKEAGLIWEPRVGDMFYWHNGKDWGIDALTYEDVNENLEETEDFIDEGVWIFAPHLDQLLAEIEKRGWKYTLISRNMNGANEDCLCWVVKWTIPTAKRGLYGVTPTEATASALLWIYEGRTDHES